MKRASLLAVVAALGLLVMAPAVQAAQSSPFSGHWQGTDPGDRSTLDAFISGGNKVQITYTDDVATQACEGAADQSFTAFLTGTIDGNVLNSTMKWAKCGSAPLNFNGFGISWTLNNHGNSNPADDVLTNSFGETYRRV